MLILPYFKSSYVISCRSQFNNYIWCKNISIVLNRQILIDLYINKYQNHFKHLNQIHLISRWDLTDTTTLDQSRPGSNSNEEMTPHFPVFQKGCLIYICRLVISRTITEWLKHLSKTSTNRKRPVDSFRRKNQIHPDHSTIKIGENT